MDQSQAMNGLLIRQSCPHRKYTVLAIDIDTTGRRLSDNILQLAVYSPEWNFCKFIMPVVHMNEAARKRHQIKIIKHGSKRRLFSTRTAEPIPCSLEYNVLTSFLTWLECIKNSDRDSSGIVLIYHELRRCIPHIVLRSLFKYNLLSRFLGSVVAFANASEFTKTVFNPKMKLKDISRSSLFKSRRGCVFRTLYSALNRAQMVYELVEMIVTDQQIVYTPSQNNSKRINPIILSNCVMSFACPILWDIYQMFLEKRNIDCKYSLRPIFLSFYKSSPYIRGQAVKYRSILAKNNIDYNALQFIWMHYTVFGLVELIETISLNQLNNNEKIAIVNIIDHHFDPNKEPLQPPPYNEARAIREHHRRQKFEAARAAAVVENAKSIREERAANAAKSERVEKVTQAE